MSLEFPICRDLVTERPASGLGSVAYEIAMNVTPLRSGFHQGTFQCGRRCLLAILSSSIDKNGVEFRTNSERMHALVGELQTRRSEAALGGSEKARERHVGRGKLLPRDRVTNLIDPGSPFLELSPLAANGMYEDAIHGAGLITGVGRIEGRECVVVCNDSTIKGGTYYPMTVKKHLRAQEVARENRLPC